MLSNSSATGLQAGMERAIDCAFRIDCVVASRVREPEDVYRVDAQDVKIKLKKIMLINRIFLIKIKLYLLTFQS